MLQGKLTRPKFSQGVTNIHDVIVLKYKQIQLTCSNNWEMHTADNLADFSYQNEKFSLYENIEVGSYEYK